MDLAALESFIVRAKANTYAGGGPRAEPTRPGSHDLTFADGEWSYRDSYFGGTDFIGQEVVWHRGEPVWAMNHYGRILDDDALTSATAGRVVMASLSALYLEGRFLGGFFHEAEGWEYRDSSEGGVGSFAGREEIAWPGAAPAYELVYHGGVIQPD